VELKATIRGSQRTIQVGSKNITADDIKVGEISKQGDGYYVRVQLSIAVGKDRNDTVNLALRKALERNRNKWT
jgi:hypothetical protein